jgi:hypothetical protein
VKNLSHSASFESFDKNAPLKSGTKQLGITENSGAIRFERFERSPIAHSAWIRKSVDKRGSILIFIDKKRLLEDWGRGNIGNRRPNHEAGAPVDEVGAVVCSSQAV